MINPRFNNTSETPRLFSKLGHFLKKEAMGVLWSVKNNQQQGANYFSVFQFLLLGCAFL